MENKTKEHAQGFEDLLHGLVYKSTDKIYLRTFDDTENNDPTKAQNFETTFHELKKEDGIQRHLHNLNENDNRGVFFVVNGGGQTDAEVNKAGIVRAHFVDFDDGSIEEQLKKIDAFPLCPSAIIRTKRGLHVYWFIVGGSIERFTHIQKRLANYFGSDMVVSNTSRVMRLPGFEHRKDASDPFMVELVSCDPEIRYTQDQLDEVLPELPEEDRDGQTTEFTKGMDAAKEFTNIPQAKSVRWVRDFLKKHGVVVYGEGIQGNDYICYVDCPWMSEHTDDTGKKQSAVMVKADGTICYHCLHNHCVNRGWSDFREHFEPNYKEEKSKAKKDETKKLISKIITLSQHADVPPERPPVLIDGVLRTGHKLLISGPSKAGKSFLLMYLSICISTGRSWLGFECKRGRVLYINLEIDGASATCRFLRIAKELGCDARDLGGVDLWNLRGMAKPLPELIPEIIELAKQIGPYVAIIIDPIYKVIIGDENSASDMGAFCNCFDKISAATGAAVIYAHHHSKGSQGQKRSIDRASGSGVFGRDPDAILDLCPLEIPEEVKRYTGKGQGYPFRVETSLREFPASDPFDIWFRYPVHVLDDTGLLDGAAPAGTSIGNLARSGKYTTSESRRLSVLAAWETCSAEKTPVTVSAMAEQMDVTTRTARDRINEQNDFVVKNGVVSRT